MLADSYDVVIGVDTHRDTHALAAVRSFDGAVLAICSISADPAGYRAALAFAAAQAPERRAWALEGTGSYGAGLARALAAHEEHVIEVDRPNRGTKRANAKSDELDAIRAARSALGREQHATPRGGPTHDALRALITTREGAVHARSAAVNQLRALVATAPDTLRERLRGQTTTAALLRRARSLRTTAKTPLDERAVILAIRLTAGRVEALSDEVDKLDHAIGTIVTETAPQLLAERGIGPISAAQLLVSWSHPGRIRSEAAFAQLAGAAPIPASSGQTRRHRLNRGGDRQLNRALHTIILSRLKYDPRTRDYLARATHQGKTRRDTIRSLKRYLARYLYRLLEPTSTSLADPNTIGPCS
jgi:transposase